MSQIYYVGVDPGQSGGLVIIHDGSYGISSTPMTHAEAMPMPATERDIWDWFEGLDPQQTVAVIEKVHSMPKQGVASTFKFGMGYGGLRMALIAAGIPFEDVTPRVWQKALSILSRKVTETKTQFKNRLKAKAQQLFPSIKVTLKTADALLIAEYCKRKHEGRL